MDDLEALHALEELKVVFTSNNSHVWNKIEMQTFLPELFLIFVGIGICRKRLFQLINDLPTIFEVVTGNVRQSKDQSGPHSNSSKIKSSGKMQQPQQPESQPKTVKTSPSPKLEDESGGDEEEDDDEQGATLCGACGENYANDEFWICCDICERWFHGKCVKITPAKAEHIKQYKCPSCSTKRVKI